MFAFGSGGDNPVKAAFACGCTMAPTSVAVALKCLTEANQLNSLPGQTIVTAAFLDDVFSIILLVLLESMTGNNLSTMDIIFSISTKFLFCFLFLAIGTILAMYFFSYFIPKLLHIIPIYDNINYQPRDELHLIIMITILISYSFIGDKIGSHLLGAFVAGMSFSQVSRSMFTWRRQMKRLNQWLIRLFFACSVAFTIPTKELLSIEAFIKGLILSIIAGIIGKVMSGFAYYKQWNYKYIIGFAMVGRGEFAYLVAGTSRSLNLIGKELYAILVWALLIAVIIAPIAFKYVLQNSFKQRIKSGVKWFTIKAEAKHHTGVHFEVVDVLHNLKLDILEAKVETDGDTDCSEFIVGVSGNDNLDKDKIHEILHDIREAVGDTNAQIQLLPIDEMDILPLLAAMDVDDDVTQTRINTTRTNTASNVVISHIGSEQLESADKLSSNLSTSSIILDDFDDSMKNEYFLEIKLMTSHSPKIFATLIEEMEQNGIELVQGHMEDFLNTDSLVIFGRFMKSHYDINVRDVKLNLKNTLKLNHGISGEILVKKIRSNNAVLPHHIKLSELLQSETNQNNPLLTGCLTNGYEVDIISNKYEQSLILLILDAYQVMELDILTIHMHVNNEEDENRFISTFFIQKSKDSNFKDKDQRDDIEFHIASIFQQKNIAATIRIKTIEMGKKEETLIETHCVKKRPSLNLTINTDKSNTPSIKALNSGNLQNLAAITESVVIITPKRASTLPPSIEKGETTFNLIGLVLDGNNENNKSIIVDSNISSRNMSIENSMNGDNLPFQFNLNMNQNNEINDEESNDTNSSNSRSDCSIIDILNE